MNQTELFQRIADENKLSLKQIKQVFASYNTLAQQQLVGDAHELLLPGMGIFRLVDRPERQGRNPATGESMTISAKRVVKFVIKKSLKDAVL